MASLRIAVIDGQGGGVGKALVEKLRAVYGKGVRITGLGTNSLVSSLLLKAGADEAAAGENAIVFNVARADVVMGAIGILSANSMLGELTPAMAAAVGASGAQKILIPLNRCQLRVAGLKSIPFAEFVDEAVRAVGEFLPDAGENRG